MEPLHPLTVVSVSNVCLVTLVIPVLVLRLHVVPALTMMAVILETTQHGKLVSVSAAPTALLRVRQVNRCAIHVVRAFTPIVIEPSVLPVRQASRAHRVLATLNRAATVHTLRNGPPSA